MLDADALIAALDRAARHHSAAARAVRRLHAERVALVLSTVTYAEALVRPAADERRYGRAIAAIDALSLELMPPTPVIARGAARLRAGGVSLPDGFAIATARAPRRRSADLRWAGPPGAAGRGGGGRLVTLRLPAPPPPRR